MTDLAETGFLRSMLGRLLGFSKDGLRDLYKAFGYPRNLELDIFENLYARGGIASRIIRAFPADTWCEYPNAVDEAGGGTTQGEDGYSPFAEAFENLCERVKLTHYLERADRLSGIGQYSVLLLGFADGADLSLPLGNGKNELAYLVPYGERNAKIVQLVQNSADPRYGLPEMYQLKQGQPYLGTATVSTKTQNVHHSRVLHIAEFLEENDIYGMPRLQPSLNYLMDLEKVVGSGAETFWLNAKPGIGLWADKEANLTPIEIARMKAQAEEWENQLRRTLVGSGMTAQNIGATVADPGPNIDKLLDLIAGTHEIPKRKLVGSERGELASSQDDDNWTAVIKNRRKNFATPSVVKPFIEKMIAAGVLPEPQGQWWCEWPERKKGEAEVAKIALDKSNALRNYTATPGAELVVPQQEFRQWLGEEPVSNYDIANVEDTAAGAVAAANKPDPALTQPLNEGDPAVKDQFGKIGKKAGVAA